MIARPTNCPSLYGSVLKIHLNNQLILSTQWETTWRHRRSQPLTQNFLPDWRSVWIMFSAPGPRARPTPGLNRRRQVLDLWRIGRNRRWRSDEVYEAWPAIGRPRDGRERDQPWRLPLSSWQYRRSVRDQWVVNPRLLARKVDQIRDHCDAPCVEKCTPDEVCCS